MTHITGHDRSQTLLLPEKVDDYVVEDGAAALVVEAAFEFAAVKCGAVEGAVLVGKRPNRIASVRVAGERLEQSLMAGFQVDLE
jgi:hypothetical protein